MASSERPSRAWHLRRIDALRERANKDPFVFATQVLGFALVLLAIARVVAPIFADLSTLGGHDWDEISAHRYLAIKSLREFHQFPFWNPYACGGYSEWANVQGGPNLVSPWLPIYWFLDLRYALRAELVGTALLSAVGTWLWASVFTKSGAARAFACLVFVVNGRWALQAATGHAWHFYYAWVPWTFWFFERALSADLRKRYWSILLGGGTIALMIYEGAIYPFPQTLVLLAIYALIRSAQTRSLAPLLISAGFVITGFCFAGPKIFPTLLDFSERPRLVESTEFIDLNAFVQALVARGQTPAARPAHVPRWGWHEYGMYIGWLAFIALLVTNAFVRTKPERALRFTAVCALLLGFGAFHEYSPWTLLHQVSIFRSQHVPTRWLYPSILLFGITAAAVLERHLEALKERRKPAEMTLLALAFLVSLDIGKEASLPMQHAFWMKPHPAERVSFHQEARVPRELQYERRDYAPEALPAMHAGVGVIECTMSGALNIWADKDASGRIPGLGARGRGAPGYRGEAYTSSGLGQAELNSFTPNAFSVVVRGAKAGDTLIVNQNYDPGWRVDGEPTQNHEDALATTLRGGDQELHFRFRPRGLWVGFLVLLLGVGGAIWSHHRLFRLPREREQVEPIGHS
ncbi:MAG TPA: hypothetical protein VHV51_19775 [Polyangiaceae bacterium]|jgi:hypothetical protein|nr:hypothetical protein [Polyangiaceae bacterium]